MKKSFMRKLILGGDQELDWDKIQDEDEYDFSIEED